MSFLVADKANKEGMEQLYEYLNQHTSDNTGLIEKCKLDPIVYELRAQLAPINDDYDYEFLDQFKEFDKPEPKYVVSKEFMRAAQNHLKILNEISLKNAFNCLDRKQNGFIERSLFKRALGYDETNSDEDDADQGS